MINTKTYSQYKGLEGKQDPASQQRRRELARQVQAERRGMASGAPAAASMERSMQEMTTRQPMNPTMSAIPGWTREPSIQAPSVPPRPIAGQPMGQPPQMPPRPIAGQSGAMPQQPAGQSGQYQNLSPQMVQDIVNRFRMGR